MTLEGGARCSTWDPTTSPPWCIWLVRRVSTSSAKAYRTLSIEVPTDVSGLLEFCAGAIVTIMSSDVHHHTDAPSKLHGEAGSLRVPAPNTFGGPVRLRTPVVCAWEE